MTVHYDTDEHSMDNYQLCQNVTESFDNLINIKTN